MFGYPDLPKYKAAAVQASPVVKDSPVWFDLKATTDKAISLIEEAGRNDARLIVFPECWLPCHPYWSIDFADRPTFREIWTKYLWNSIEVPGPVTEALGAAAKKAKAYVVMGINERDAQYHGRMYNSVIYLGPDGSIIGTHRKICNTVAERLFHTPGDGGDNLKTVFKTDIGIIGGSICGEHHQLLLTYNWIMQGMQVHCSLWPGHKTLSKIADISTRALSISSHCYSVSAATFIQEGNRPKNFYRNSAFNDQGFFSGGSMIVDPSGEYIAGPVFDEETIVYGEIDLSKVDKSLMATNLTGSYSRWDLMNINIREQPYEPVMSLENSSIALSDIGSGPHRLGHIELRLMELEEQIAALRREQKTLRISNI